MTDPVPRPGPNTHDVHGDLVYDRPSIRPDGMRGAVHDQGLPMRSRSLRTLLAVPAVLAMALTACGGDGGTETPDDTAGTETQADGQDGDTADGPTVAVGSFNFPESTILAEIYAQALEDAGIDVERQLNIGARELIYPDLEGGAIDLLPEYVGSALTVRFEGEATADVQASLDALNAELESVGLVALEPAEAEDKNVFVVTQQFADDNGVQALGDLADVDGVTMGGPPECEDRATCFAGIVEAYGLDGLSFQTIQETPIRVQSLANGEIDLALLFSTDPTIEEQGFVVLDDPDGVVAAENVVPVVNQEIVDAYGDTLTGVLDEVSAALTTEALLRMNGQANAGDDPAEIAAQWLEENGLVG